MLEKLGIELTPVQKQHIGSLIWLLADREEDRRSGRSFLMAITYIAAAYEHHDRAYRVRDHFARVNNDHELIQQIKMLCNKFPENISERFIFRHDEILYTDREVKFHSGEPCNHPGCAAHKSHPCEGCGRIATRGAVFGNSKYIKEI